MNDLMKRKGFFQLPEREVKRAPRDAIKIMAGMLITRCEHSFLTESIYYEAVCDEFEILEAHDRLPEYVIMLVSGKRMILRKPDDY